MTYQEQLAELKHFVQKETLVSNFEEKAKSQGIKDTKVLVQSLQDKFDNLKDTTQLDSETLSAFKEVVVPLLAYSYFGAVRICVEKYNVENKILFKECYAEFVGIFQAIYHQAINFGDKLSCYLLSSINIELDYKDYTKAMFEKDIAYLYDLCCVEYQSDEKYNEAVLEDIKASLTDKSIMPVLGEWSKFLKSMYSVLGVTYKNTFSLYPYLGVLTFMGTKETTRKAKTSTGKVIETTDSYNYFAITQNENNTQRELRVKTHERAVGNIKIYQTDGNTVNAYQSFTTSLESKDMNTEFKKINEDHPYIRSDRCFDIDEILNGEHSLYYPFGAFAFAIGAEFSDYYKPALADYTYNKVNVLTWNEYEDYLHTKIDPLFIKYIYKALEKYCTYKGNNFKFLDEEFIDEYDINVLQMKQTDAKKEGKVKVYEKFCNSKQFNSVIAQAIKRLCTTLCKTVTIMRNDSNELYKLRICSESVQSFDIATTPSKLFNHKVLTKNLANVKFPDGICVSESVASEAANLGVVVMEYQFALTPELADAKPLFGYKAAQLFQRTGQKISNTNLLLGEDPLGNPLFSTNDKDAKSPINTIDKVVHRFSAGSRSGKGVITMNILASLMASDTVLFYIDRKPDMSSELSYLSEGNMYCVNGGSLTLGTDTRHQYIKGNNNYGPALQKFEQKSKASFRPSYMTEVFGNDFGETWNGAFGDLIYERAYLFAIAIMLARFLFFKDGQVVNELGMDKNMAIVIDEITNWHERFEREYFCNENLESSLLSKSVWSKFYKGDYGATVITADTMEEVLSNIAEDKRQHVKELQQQLDILRTEKVNNSASWTDDKEKQLLKLGEEVQKQLKTLAQQKKDIPQHIKEGYLYWTTFFDKMQETLNELESLKKASWNANMATRHDVFMIGQSLTGVRRGGAPILFNKSEGKEGADREVTRTFNKTKYDATTSTGDATTSFLVNFAETLGNDWFTGRLTDPSDKNKKINNFSGDSMKTADPKLFEWTQLKGNWIYIPDGTQEQFRGNSADCCPKNYVLLKPYLVLNNNDEPPENMTEKEVYSDGNSHMKYVYDCKTRINETADNPDMWSLLRSDFLDEDGNQLHKGIGFEGLVEEYKKTQDLSYNLQDAKANGQNPFAGSKQIADFVAHLLNPKYNDYMDLLLDLTPQGLYNYQDVYRVVSEYLTNGNTNGNNLELQLPRYIHSGNEALIGLNTVSESGTESKKSILDDIDFNSQGDSSAWEYKGASNDSSQENTDTTPINNTNEQPSTPDIEDTQLHWGSNVKNEPNNYQSSPEVSQAFESAANDMSDLDKGLYTDLTDNETACMLMCRRMAETIIESRFRALAQENNAMLSYEAKAKAIEVATKMLFKKYGREV